MNQEKIELELNLLLQKVYKCKLVVRKMHVDQLVVWKSDVDLFLCRVTRLNGQEAEVRVLDKNGAKNDMRVWENELDCKQFFPVTDPEVATRLVQLTLQKHQTERNKLQDQMSVLSNLDAELYKIHDGYNNKLKQKK